MKYIFNGGGILEAIVEPISAKYLPNSLDIDGGSLVIVPPILMDISSETDICLPSSSEKS